MPLPRGDEYQIAVQNPRSSFTDPDIKTCTVETDQIGLPKPYAGGFTTTYHFTNGSRGWAARCFTRDIPDLQKRYEAIGLIVAKNQASFFVDATCLVKGIQINGGWYPIIKMQWVQGDQLNLFIRKILNFPNRIQKLRDDFTKLITNLETLGIAHGDLQHGNIIVEADKLFLIDYDGMFLPELASLPVSEIGHINYQHPDRNIHHYNSVVDRFSSIVIYLGLTALTLQPELWNKYDNSENILFRRDDFVDPDKSPLINDLISTPAIRPLVERFKAICANDFEKIPTLGQFTAGNFAYTQAPQPVRSVYIRRSQYPVIDASRTGTLLEHFGERIEVVGYISAHYQGFTNTKHRLPYLFLNFGRYPHQTFTLVLWSTALDEFKNSNLDPITYTGKWVSVTGVVSAYKGKPQVVVEMPSQVQIIKGEEEAKHLLTNLQPVMSPSVISVTKKADWPVSTPLPAKPSIPFSVPSATGTSNTKSTISAKPAVPVDRISQQEANALNNLYGTKASQPLPTTLPAAKVAPENKISNPPVSPVAHLAAQSSQANKNQSSSSTTQQVPLSKKDDQRLLNGLSGKPAQQNPPSANPSGTPSQKKQGKTSHIFLACFVLLAILLTINFPYIGSLANNFMREPVKTVPGLVKLTTTTPSPTHALTFTMTVTQTPAPTDTITPSADPTIPPIITGCATSNINVRNGPGISYQVIDWLNIDKCVQYDGITPNGDWVRIAPDQGVKVGWIAISKLKVSGDIIVLPTMEDKVTTTTQP